MAMNEVPSRFFSIGPYRFHLLPLLVACGLAATGLTDVKASDTAARRPHDEKELRFWLTNMVGDHGFTVEEVRAATGLSDDEVHQAVARLAIKAAPARPYRAGDPIRVLPYPGGRHPRIGFLEGAIRPQRDTKFSVFTPWDDSSYVVVDLPEAIWSNLGLTYLAHTHVPTIWSAKGVALDPQEWRRKPNGSLTSERRLPNGIIFSARVVPTPEAVRMELRLINGTSAPLSDLRVQQCVMLKGTRGFTRQTNDNKVFSSPYAACRSENGDRWVITAWVPCHRVWGNAPCPCLHSDPKFPDCPAGETRFVRGWLSFYEGKDISDEFERIDATGWRTASF